MRLHGKVAKNPTNDLECQKSSNVQETSPSKYGCVFRPISNSRSKFHTQLHNQYNEVLKTRKWKCLRCLTFFKTENDVLIHGKEKHMREKFTEKSYMKEPPLIKVHERHNVWFHKCNLCGIENLSQKSMVEHNEMMHSVKSANFLECIICGLKFATTNSRAVDSFLKPGGGQLVFFP